MWFQFVKFFLIINASTQAPTSLMVSNAPNEVNYDITKEMVKHVKYHEFDSWATIPWNSAYFDIDQPDLKLVSGNYIGNRNQMGLRYVSTVAGVPLKAVILSSGVTDFNNLQLNNFSRIMFNHNFISNSQKNYLQFVNVDIGVDYQTELNFEIDKPLSFYIQGFMFYFEYSNFATFTANFTFSFLDYEGNVKYIFKGKVDNNIYGQDLYNFVTMPIRVPNLRHLTVFFDVQGTPKHISQENEIKLGQLNIFSSEKIDPVPPNSPFSPDYERVSWYDLFGHLRNAFRWLLYGVVGGILPVEPLRHFFATIDKLLRSIFDDTISSVLNVDFTSGLEQVLTLWVFLKAVGFLIG